MNRAAASFSSESTSSYTCDMDSHEEASENQLRDDKLLHGLGLNDESRYE